MNIALAVGWGKKKRRILSIGIVAMTLASSLLTPGPKVANAENLVSVIVRAGGNAETARDAVEFVGGTVGRPLGIIRGFVARVPRDAIDDLARMTGVASVTRNGRVDLMQADTGFGPDGDLGSMHAVAKLVGAPAAWAQGYTGQGIDIALLDTGIAPVPGLDAPGKVVNGPDLSFDSQVPELEHLDAFGHGTHMAGIMVGNDTGSLDPQALVDPDAFVGIAPGARVVNVKVGAWDGAVDVSQVIAGIDWVVQHRADNGLNIRVLNLSFGTDGTQDYKIDPLAYAAEVAWRKGIAVVVAGGNDGTDRLVLANPALDPFLIAVGADDPMGTMDRSDDTVPPFATRGTLTRHVDVVAPGVHIASLRVPGSVIDTNYPGGAVSEQLFRGSGTSQAAAVTSGAVALLLQARPATTPDQMKQLLSTSAYPLRGVSYIFRGSGLIDVAKALSMRTPSSRQAAKYSTGTGSLDAARGTIRVADETSALTGEFDIFGTAWNGRQWSADAWAGTSWSDGDWNGNTWTGSGWSGSNWRGYLWSGTSWSGRQWSDYLWSGRQWSGRQWSGDGWAGRQWSGDGWAGRQWSSFAYN